MNPITQKSTHLFSYRLKALVMGFCGLIAGCSNHSGYHYTPPATKEALQLLKKASQSANDSKQSYELIAAKLFLNDHNTAQAQTLLRQINSQSLSPEQEALKSLLLARLDLLERHPKASLLALASLNESDILSDDAKIDLLVTRSQALQETGYPIEAAKACMSLDALYHTPAEIAQNRQRIWYLLNKASIAQLKSFTPESHLEAGWLSLAVIMKTNSDQPDQFSRDLADWSATYPAHPAQSLFATSSPDQPTDKTREAQHIALLLPLNGSLANAAHAVRDGFMAAYYHRLTPQYTPSIKIYDTANDTRVSEAYDEALKEDADLVIGPLTKEGVKSLFERRTSTLPIPTITLNQLESQNSLSSKYPNIYQLGLSPEDEVHEAVLQAWNNGYLHALILTPSTAWGNRLSSLFENEWRRQGGEIIDTLSFEPNTDLSKSIQQILHLPQSQQRANALKQILGPTFDYEPRRRHDIDVIFLGANPKQARQIAPLLAFYYASDIPVYATSSIYTGIVNPQQDRDMDGTTFCDAPWAINQTTVNDDLKKEIKRLWPNDSNYLRMFGLGVDAYQIIPYLGRLSQFPSMVFKGTSGDLFLDGQGQFRRVLNCATFVKGQPKLLMEPRDKDVS